MKKLISLLLVVITLLLFATTTARADSMTATKVELTVSVDGRIRSLDAYAINDYNYFKLRDIAYLLSSTPKRFEVTWDGSKNAINLITGKTYTAVGNELAMLPYWNNTKTAIPNTSTVLLDGKEIKLTAYTIDGYNYFKLRDIASMFDFFVDWDSNYRTVIIETTFGYEPENNGDNYSYRRNVNVGNTQVERVNNWARISPVQQFSYLNEGLAYGYESDDNLIIVTPGKELSIEMKYPRLGDVISDDEGNFYIVWGKNGSENTDQTVFVSKYSPAGVHIKTTGFVGEGPMGPDGNTKIPFEAGNCVSTIHNGVLMVNYARTMYNGHQSNNVIAVNIKDMSPYRFEPVIWDSNMANIPYVSHSFNQGLIYSKIADDFVFANHGDAFGRGFIVEKLRKEMYVDYDSLSYMSKYPQHNIFHFYLEPNANYNMYIVNKTFAQFGGLAETSRGVVLVGASAKSIGEEAKTEKQNLFVQIFNPLSSEVSPSMFVGGSTRTGATSTDIYDNSNSPLTEVTDYGVIWLTNYTDRDVIAPQVVVGDDRIVIFWTEERKPEGMYHTPDEFYCESYYMILSAEGQVITPKTSLGRIKLNSYEMPVYHNGSVYWAYTDRKRLRVVSISVN